MMKKIILAVSLMFGGAMFVNAQEQQQTDTTQTQTQTEQSDMYRQDTTSTDDSQNQTPTQNEQSDMYKTETDSTTTGTEATTTTPTTDDQSATTPTEQTGVTSEDQEQEGEKIEVSELPAAVSTKLQSTDYQGWVVVSARKKMWKDPADTQAVEKEVYVIEAKNGAETKKLKFDKDGNEIEHDKNKKDDQK